MRNEIVGLLLAFVIAVAVFLIPSHRVVVLAHQ
jgi:hypothetical protein